MTPTKFKELLAIVKSKIEKKHTNWRRPISAATRLALTIRHLATEESKRSLSYQYLIGRSTVTLIVAETTEAIWTSMKSQCLKAPTQSTFQTIADKFLRRWNFQNCIGAIDGLLLLKHWKIKAFNDTATDTFRLILKFLAPLITSLRGVGTRDIIFLVASTIPREERSMVY